MNSIFEEWRELEEFNGVYAISNLGRVKLLKSRHKSRINSILKTINNSSGYQQVRMSKNGKQKSYFVHRLVMLTFCPNPDYKKLDVNHKDCIKSNNRLDNLEWLSHKQNTVHARKSLLTWNQQKGERVGVSKLKENQVLEIRRLCQIGMKQKDVAKLYNIDKSNISNIVLRKIWTHI